MADIANTTTAFCTNYVPCNDSPLSRTASIAQLVILGIAIYAILKFYVSSYNNSVEGMDQLLSLLTVSLDECTDALAASEAYLDGTSAAQKDDRARNRAEAVQKAANGALYKVNSLHQFRERVLSPSQQKWFGPYRRGVFAALQAQLSKKISEMDGAMDVLRLAVKRYEQYQDQLHRERQGSILTKLESMLASQSEFMEKIAQRLGTIEKIQLVSEAASSPTTRP